MYDAARVAADGRTTAARFAVTAAEAGFDGVVVANSHENPAEYDPAAIADAYDIDVVDGVEIATTDKGELSGAVTNHRRETTALLVRGGTETVNRYAVETPAVDVLRDPMAGNGDVNHVVVKAAARNDVRIEVNFGPVLRASGGPRVQALRGLRKLRALLKYFDAPFVVSAAPTTHLQVRGPRELIAVGEQIGFEADQVRAGLAEWRRIAEENREKLSSAYVTEGVRRGRYDE
ncbi:MAG: RNase P subunit p30 family protein [Halanaeroarchaeum sp.]